MRTNIEIDEELIAKAMAATGQTTKRATVEEALRTVVRLHQQRRAVERLAGGWVGKGNLEGSRAGRGS